MPDTAAAEEEDDEEEEQEEDEAVEGLRGGSGGGGEEGVSLGTVGTDGLAKMSGEELCETNERLRTGNGGGTSHPKLSHPPPSAAPGRWSRLLLERPSPPPPG